MARKHNYVVIVGNVGTVYRGHKGLEAAKVYTEYVAISKAGRGRAGGEGVVLMQDGEPLREHQGDAPGDRARPCRNSRGRFTRGGGNMRVW